MNEHEERERATQAVQGLVLADLALAGYEFDSLDDLRHSGVRYRSAVPVLLKWLPLVSDLEVKAKIARALSVPWARPTAAHALIDEFKAADAEIDPEGTGYRWVVGNALEVVGDDSVFGELSGLALDRGYGKARQMVVLGLGRSKDPRALGVLVELLDDDDVSGHAVRALGKLGEPAARPAIESMLTSSSPWVRREAKKALARLS